MTVDLIKSCENEGWFLVWLAYIGGCTGLVALFFPSTFEGLAMTRGVPETESYTLLGFKNWQDIATPRNYVIWRLYGVWLIGTHSLLLAIATMAWWIDVNEDANFRKMKRYVLIGVGILNFIEAFFKWRALKSYYGAFLLLNVQGMLVAGAGAAFGIFQI